MDPTIISSSRRRRIGSVWETRMQSDDQVNNAIVLHGSNEDKNCNKQLSLKEETLGVNNGKRRTWNSKGSDLKSPSSVRANSMKLTRPRSIGSTPPMTPRRSISSDDKSQSVSVVKKMRSESVDGVEKATPGRVKKTRSELCTTIVKAGEFDSVELRKVNSLPSPNPEKSDEKTEHIVDDAPKDETVDDDNPKIPEEIKDMVSDNSNVVDEQIEDGDKEEEERKEEEDKEEEKKSVDVKEINVTKENNKNRVGNKISQFHNGTVPSPSSVRKISPPVIKRTTFTDSVPLNSTPRTEEEDNSTQPEDNSTQPQSKLQSLVDLVMWRDVSRSTLVFGFGTFLIISSSYANDLNISFISVVAYMALIYLGVMFVLKLLIHRGMVEERQKVAGVKEEDVKRMLRLIMPYLNESMFQLRALFSGDPSTTLKMGLVLFVLARCGSSITLWNLAKFGFIGAFTVPKIFISYSTHFSAYGNFWIRRFRDAWETCNHKKAVALALFTLVWNLSSVTARVWAAFMLLVAFRYYQQKMIWTNDHNDDDDDDDDENIADEEEEEEEVTEQVPKFKRAHHMMMPNKLKKIS